MGLASIVNKGSSDILKKDSHHGLHCVIQGGHPLVVLSPCILHTVNSLKGEDGSYYCLLVFLHCDDVEGGYHLPAMKGCIFATSSRAFINDWTFSQTLSMPLRIASTVSWTSSGAKLLVRLSAFSPT